MVDLEQEVEVTWTSNYKHYINMGYQFTKCRDKFLAKAKDLPLNSKYKIKVICDYCGKEFLKPYVDIINYDSISCSRCKFDKAHETNLIKYGNRIPNGTNKLFEELRDEFLERGLVIVSCDMTNFNYKTRIQYICKNHSDKTQETNYSNFKFSNVCKYCGIEKSARNRRASIEEVRKIFAHNNRRLLVDSYDYSKQKLPNVCLNHPEIIQYSTLDQIKAGYMCRYCEDELTRGKNSCHWKGGMTPLHSFLREKMIEWKTKTMQDCGYKCLITGSRFDDIHHIFGFNFILDELFKITNLSVKNIGDYTPDELELLVNTCKQLHEKHGAGACMTHDAHLLYHSIYGYGSNTPEQFSEFKARFAAGEFNDQLAM